MNEGMLVIKYLSPLSLRGLCPSSLWLWLRHSFVTNSALRGPVHAPLAQGRKNFGETNLPRCPEHLSGLAGYTVIKDPLLSWVGWVGELRNSWPDLSQNGVRRPVGVHTSLRPATLSQPPPPILIDGGRHAAGL